VTCDKRQRRWQGETSKHGAWRRCAVRILLVCPDIDGVNSIPEVRRIQAWHDCSTLYGTVTIEDVYRLCQEKQFDVIHFASHGGPDGIQLSNNIILTAEDIAQAVRLKETKGVFLNACNTGKVASYVVRHGALWAISSEIELNDADAWKLASAFYSHQRNGTAKDFVGAYLLADSGDGEYSLVLNPAWIQDLQRATIMASSPHTALATLTRTEAIRFGMLLVAASVVLSYLIVRLALFGG
jgi:hypothetical protein